jgi:plasmid maintenance system antidote protein VapI
LRFLIKIKDEHAVKDRYYQKLEKHINFVRELIDLDDEELNKLVNNKKVLTEILGIRRIVYKYFNTT